MSILQIINIEKKYKKKIALAPLSLTINEGECAVLCGGNGAGKSTLLNILAGISTPTSGSVVLDGVDMKTSRHQYVSQIGYMPDDFYAQEMMTVNEFLAFYGSLRNVKSHRVHDVLKLLGLDEKKKEFVKHLSKGMRQRLFFGQAILAKPKFLILDEPTNGLDPYWVDSFTSILQEIKSEGTVIVFSTHMMDIAAQVGDHILFLKDGKIVKEMVNTRDDVQKFTLELLELYHQ